LITFIETKHSSIREYLIYVAVLNGFGKIFIFNSLPGSNSPSSTLVYYPKPGEPPDCSLARHEEAKALSSEGDINSSEGPSPSGSLGQG
jgi:hypothetical protein